MKLADSIRRKVTLTLFGAFVLALVAAASAVALFEYRSAEIRARISLESLADTLASSLVAALDFDSPDVAAQNLAQLEPSGAILAATVFRTDGDNAGHLFTTYRRARTVSRFPQELRPVGFYRQRDHVLLVQPLLVEGREVGRLLLEADVGVFRRGLRNALEVLAVIFVVLAAASYGLSRLLQRAITRPIVQLAETAAQVYLTSDFNLRVPVTTQDEIGNLSLSFNEMLTGIALRDRQLAAQTAFQQAVLDHAGLAIVTTATDGTIRTFNAAAERMLGYTAAEMIGCAKPVVFHDAAEMSWHAAELTRALGREIEPGFAVLTELANRESPAAEWTYVRKDGSHFPVLLVLSTLRTATSETLGLCAIAADLTERKQAEAQLRLESAALAAAANAIVITDRGGLVQRVNPAFTALTGYTAEEAIGRNLRELVKSGQHDAAFYRRLWTTILAGHVWRGEITNRRKDGSLFIEEQTITPVRDEHGEIAHFVAIKQDITERKKLEKQLLRTQRLESVGRLASGIAHDLNNILAPMLMATPILREAIRDPAAGQIVDIINTNAQRGTAIIKQLLAFSRGMEGRRTSLQLKSLLRDMELIIAETFPKNIRVHLDMPPEPWLVTSDPTQLHQVLMNLCVNARDAMPPGGTLTLGLENVQVDPAFAATIPGAQPGRYVRLSVTDTGTGIAPQVLDKIYDPFFSTKEIGRGTGLGLSTVLGIVKNHQGFVQVKSELGRGTRFNVYLPACAAVEAMLPPAEEKPLRGKGELVLVVDDEESVRQVTRHILRAYGYRVTDFGDAADGLDWYARHGAEARVVITDLLMPGMDGAVFIRKLRRLNPQVLIIAASGKQPEAGVPESVTAEAQASLAKPFTVEVLLRTLHRVLHPSEPGAPSPT